MNDRIQLQIAYTEQAEVRHRMQAATTARIEKLALDGLTAIEISRALGVSRSVVCRRLREAGIGAVPAKDGRFSLLPNGSP